MNQQQPADKLDALLRGWAERRQAAQDLDALEQRILAAVAEESSRGNLGDPCPSPAVSDRHRLASNALAWFSIGAAAIVAAVACWLLIGGNGKGNVPAQQARKLPPRSAWLDGRELGEKGRLIREMEWVFDHRLQWIAETGGRVLLEVQSQPATDAAELCAPLAAHIVVVRRDPRQPQAAPVWTVDVVARQERVILLSAESAGLPEGMELRFWAYPVDEEMVAVDSSLSLPGLALAWDFSSVQKCGEPLAVCRVERSGVEYEVFQTVARLDKET